MAARKWTLFAVVLAGCPSAVPESGQFAGATTDTIADHGGIADSDATNDTATLATTDVPATETDAGAAETTAADVPGDTAKDAAAATAICPQTGCVGLFAKVLDGGAQEFVHALVPVSDGGALLVGETGNNGSETDAWLQKVGAVGTVAWAKTVGKKGEEEARAGLATADGGFVVAGMTRAAGAGQGDGWLVRLDKDGKVTGEFTYGGTGHDAFYGIAPADNGAVVCAGSNRSLSGSLEDGWLARIDAGSEPVWQQKYGGGQIDEFFAVVAAPGGKFAAAGANRSKATSGADAWLLVADGKGSEVVSKVYHSGEYDEARALAVLPDGGFVLTGQGSVKGNPELWLIRTDANGTLLWQDVIGGNQSESGRAVAVLADGGVAVAGETDSTPAGGSSSGVDGWLLRWDAWGNRTWQQRFGGGGNEWLTALAIRPDGGLLLGGRVFTSGATLDGWLVRTDAWGHATCTGLGPCKDKLASDCDDANPCTADRCDPVDGCTHTPLQPGARCGSGKACGAGACQG